jgi:NADPH:quinone reductase-like Zn-dependent oxidoreductase
MKAIVYRRYGPPNVVALAEMPKPVPKAHDVLVRIRATTVSTADWRARSLDMPAGFGLLGRLVFGLLGPRQPILGTELAGVVEAVGSAVTRFRPGDEVFASTGARFGCHAEYRTVPEDGLIVLKPASISFEEAAALCFGITTALPLLRDRARIMRGDRVLVVGASGCVGSAAVQVARYFGAEVSGVCSAANVELVRSLGVDRVIDYTREDFATTGETYDIIFDTTGTAPYSRSERALKPGGRLIVVLGSFAQLIGIGAPSKASGKTVISQVATMAATDMALVAQLAERRDYRAVIDRIYPLESAAEAHAYVDTGRKRGSVVLSVA